MPDDLEQISAEEAAMLDYEDEMRSRVKVFGGKYWRRNTWEILYELLCDEGEFYVGRASPDGTALYAAHVALLCEYLGEHPSPQRFSLLLRRVRFDLQRLKQTLTLMVAMYRGARPICDNPVFEKKLRSEFPFDPDEHALLRAAEMKLRDFAEALHKYCSDS